MKNLSLNAKVISMLTLSVVGTVVIAFIGITTAAGINESLNHLTDTVARRALLARTVDSHANELRAQIRELILEEEPEKMKRVSADISGTVERIDKSFQEYYKLADVDVKTLITDLNKQVDQWGHIAKEVTALSLEGKNTEARAHNAKHGVPLLEAVKKELAKLVERNEAFMEEASKATDEQYEKSRMLMFALIGSSMGRRFTRSAKLIVCRISRLSRRRTPTSPASSICGER